MPVHSEKRAFESGKIQKRSAQGCGSGRTFPSLDTYPTQCGTARVPPGGGVCGQHVVGRFYPREEPDALMSTRPGLCGGHRATGVPTAIQPSRSIDRSSNNRLTRHTIRISHELDRKSCKSSLLHEVHVTVPLQEFKITHPVKIILRAQFHFRVLDDLG